MASIIRESNPSSYRRLLPNFYFEFAIYWNLIWHVSLIFNVVFREPVLERNPRKITWEYANLQDC